MNLAALMLEPARRMRQVRAEAGFVNDQDRCIHDAVREPCLREHPVAFAARAAGSRPVSAGDILQILDDDPAVVDRAAVMRSTRHGIFAERILLAQRIASRRADLRA